MVRSLLSFTQYVQKIFIGNIMKTANILKRLLTTTVILTGMAAGTAQALPYVHDTKLGSANLGNSSDADELAALLDAAGLAASDYTKYEKDTDAEFNIQANTGASGEWFIDVDPAKPGFFLLKFGAGSTGLDTHYFFQNIGELDKLVFSDADVNNLTGGCTTFNGCNSGRLSHYMFTDDVGGPLPEPATLALFGLGLMSLLYGRRKFGP